MKKLKTNNSLFFRKLSLILVAVGVVFTVFGTVRRGFAFPVSIVANPYELAKEQLESISISTTTQVAVNAVNYFGSAIALRLAQEITTGCPGQKSCWESRDLLGILGDTVGEAVGTLNQALKKDTSNAGQLLNELGLDICAPNLNLTLQIQLGLINSVRVPKPKCTWDQLSAGWENFKDQLSPDQLLNQSRYQFKPGQAPISAFLEINNRRYDRIQEATGLAKLNWLGQQANGGLKSIQDIVSGRVKSPPRFTQNELDWYQGQTKEVQKEAQDYVRAQLTTKAWENVAISVASTFGQTLLSFYWNKLVNGLLSTEALIAQQPNIILNEDGTLQRSKPLSSATLRFLSPTPRSAGAFDILTEMSICPSRGVLQRTSSNCVIDQSFAQAVRSADGNLPLTVQEALDQGLLNANWPLISSSANAGKDSSQFCFQEGYCESNLKKLRAARIIPIGWELAANKSPAGKPVTLGQVVSKFNECNSNGLTDATNPWCHLIDPNWVLRVPLTQCRAQVYGPFLQTSQASTRSQVCVDEPTCLKQDENGNCVGGYGYCTAEKNIWFFSGDSCPAQFDSCRSLTDAKGTQKNFLLNTVDYGVCSSGNAGCSQYALERNAYTCFYRDSNSQPATCATASGCACRVPAQTCAVVRGGRSCQLNDGSFCTNRAPCVPASGSATCSCATAQTCTVASGARSCSVSAGNPTDATDDWKTLPARFLNAQAKSCPVSEDGCSATIPLDLTKGESLNLIRNGGFETLEDGDGDSKPDHPKYWTPFGKVPISPTGTNGEVVTDRTVISGSNSIRLTTSRNLTAAAGGRCTLNSACTSSAGCTCSANDFSCLVGNGRSCLYTNRVMQARIPVVRNKTYTLSAVFRADDAGARVGPVESIMFLSFYNRTSRVTLSPTNVAAVKAFSAKAADDRGNCYVDPNGDLELLFLRPGLANPSAGNTDTVASCTFSINQTITHATLEIDGVIANTLVDNVQLEEGGGSAFKDGYGVNPPAATYLKLAPDYLGCTGAATDPAACASYAGVCRESEVGCDKFTPTSGDPAVPAVPSLADSCPAQCVGYNVFKQLASQFDAEKFPLYFIPATARQCTRSDVGCSEFTNLNNESKEYYSGLRICQLPSETDSVNYYSWEGSDTAGYQLKVWNLKRTGSTVAQSNPPDGSASDLCANRSCSNADYAPCTAVNAAGICNNNDTTGVCNRNAIDAGGNDCREFYDALGNRHYRLLSKTILATADCTLYRSTVSTQSDCANSNGAWNSQKSECTYRASGANSNSCSVGYNGCRAYNGNASSNVRSVLTDTFESSLGGWSGVGATATLSPEAVTIGGKSLKIPATAPSAKVIKDVTNLTRRGRTYNLTFWARGTGQLDIGFENGPTTICQNTTAAGVVQTCSPTAPATNCACAAINGLKCNISSGAQSCTIAARSGNLNLTKFSTAGNASATPTVRLATTWAEYSLGPVQLNDPNWATAAQVLAFATSGATSDVFLDSIVLKEVQDNIYVVRDSWNTPAICDQTLAGTPSPREMLGCRAYSDSQNQTRSFKSFSQLCREAAVGCSAYSSTQNTPKNPYEETWSAVCQYKDATGAPASCSGNSACSCDYDLPSPIAGAVTTLPSVCNVAIGESTCRFALDAGDYATSAADYPDRVVVPADARNYLVVKPSNVCTQQNLGCKAVGVPNIAFENTCLYDGTGSGGSYCTQANGQLELRNGRSVACGPTRPLGGLNAFGCSGNNVCLAVPATCNRPGGCSCTDSASGQTCTVQEGQKSCNVSYQYGVTTKWGSAGVLDDPANFTSTLCTEPALMCQTYTTSAGPVYFKDPGNQTCSYKQNVTYPFVCNLGGACRSAAGSASCTCNNGGASCEVSVGASQCTAQIKVSGWFRDTQNGGTLACYPELLKNGSTFTIDKNADITCQLPQACNPTTDPQGCICTNTNGVVNYRGQSSASVGYQIVGRRFCVVPPGGTICGYQGWVGQCKPETDKCEEFVDPLDATPSNPNGQPYYYLKNEKLDTSSCAAGASLQNGCVLFRESKNLTLNYSASATYGLSNQSQGIDVTPVTCNNAGGGACGNRCYALKNGTCRSGGQACKQDTDCGTGGVCTGDPQYGFGCSQNSECNATGGEKCVEYQTCGGTLNGKYCRTDNDCPNFCTAAGACLNNSTFRCKFNSDCTNIGLSGLCQAVLGSNKDDSNIVIKVRRDRQCSEWLSCATEESVFDPQTNKWRGVCTSLGACNEVGGASDGSAFECTNWIYPKKQLLSENVYASRDTSYRGTEYSGFSIPKRYPVQYLSPVSVIPGRCLNSTNNVPRQNNSNDIYCGNETLPACPTGSYCSAAMNGVCKDPIANSNTGKFCNNNSDCTPSNISCSSSGRCSAGNAACSNAGSPCTAQIGGQSTAGICMGACSNNSNIACTANLDCSPNYCQLGENIKFAINVTTCQSNNNTPSNTLGSACSDDGECSTGEACKIVTCATKANCNNRGYSNEACVSGKCVVGYDGSAVSNTTNEEAACRGYPESDSPYSSSVVSVPQNATVSNPDGYNKYGNAQGTVSNFAGANVCIKGNWCECSYQKTTYGQNQSLVRFQSYLNAMPPSSGAFSVYNGICVGGPYEGKPCTPNNPPANLGQPNVQADTQCGAQGEGGTCTAISKISYAVGWEGLCVDNDQSININNSRTATSCNLWLPVDRLPGSFDSWNQNKEAGFNPANPTQPLLYCQAAEGNDLGGGLVDPKPYERVIKYDPGNRNNTNYLNWFDTSNRSGTGGPNNFPRPNFNFSPVNASDLRSGIVEANNAVVLVDASIQNQLPNLLDKSQIAGFRIDFLGGDNRYMYLYPSTSGAVDDWTNAHYWNNDADQQVTSKCENSSDDTANCVSGGTTRKIGPIIGEDPTACAAIFTATENCLGANRLSPLNTELRDRLIAAGVAAYSPFGFENCLVAKAVFDRNSKLAGFATGLCRNGGTGTTGEYVPTRVTILFREACLDVAQTYNNNISNWASSVALTNQLLGSNKPNLLNAYIPPAKATSEPNKTDATSSAIAYFGAPQGLLVGQNPTGSPLTLSLDPLRRPYSLFSSEQGSFFTSVEPTKNDNYCAANVSNSACGCVAANNNRRTFIGFGTQASGSNDACGRYNYTYDITQRNNSALASSQASGLAIKSTDFGIAGFPFACAGNCGQGGQASPTVPGGQKNRPSDFVQVGEQALNSIFALAWDLFQWRSGQAGSTYATRAKTSTSASVSVWDDRIAIMSGALPGGGGAAAQPQLKQVDLRNCKAQGTCREGGLGNITVNAQQSGVVTGVGGRLRVTLQYYGYADKDHMPIRRKLVDFGDGRGPQVSAGYFKNRRGSVITNGREISACDGSTWGTTTQSCDNLYFEERVTYLCSQARLNSLPQCTGLSGSVYPCARGNSCVFRPRVQLLDNWQACNGTCPNGPRALCINQNFDQGSTFRSFTGFVPSPNQNTSGNNQACEFDGTTNYDGSNNQNNRPWTAYSGEIVVTPAGGR